MTGQLGIRIRPCAIRDVLCVELLGIDRDVLGEGVEKWGDGDADLAVGPQHVGRHLRREVSPHLGVHSAPREGGEELLMTDVQRGVGLVFVWGGLLWRLSARCRTGGSPTTRPKCRCTRRCAKG